MTEKIVHFVFLLSSTSINCQRKDYMAFKILKVGLFILQCHLHHSVIIFLNRKFFEYHKIFNLALSNIVDWGLSKSYCFCCDQFISSLPITNSIEHGGHTFVFLLSMTGCLIYFRVDESYGRNWMSATSTIIKQQSHHDVICTIFNWNNDNKF